MGVYGKGQKVKGNSEKVATIVNVEDIYADLWRVDEVVSLLKNGALGVIPTDTCYSFVASLSHANAVDRLLRLKGGSGHKKPLSVLCKDLSQISEYTEQFNAKWVYKLLKATLPGPFTFILPASKAVPKIVMSDKIHPKRWRRKEIGIRLPDDPIYEAIIGQLDEPLLCGSVPGQPEDWSEINLALRARENEGDNSDDDDRMDVSSQQDDMSREEITMAYPWTNQVDFIVEAGWVKTYPSKYLSILTPPPSLSMHMNKYELINSYVYT